MSASAQRSLDVFPYLEESYIIRIIVKMYVRDSLKTGEKPWGASQV